MASMYSLRVEAEQRTTSRLDLNSRTEFPALGEAGKQLEGDDLETSSSDEPAAQLDLTVEWNAGSVEFSAGNPRVEHITGVVHLYREPSKQHHAASQPAAAPSESANTPAQASQALPHLPEGRAPVLCCLAIPADMSMADFCAWCGAYLSTIRSMRVLRREARQRVVCMVLIRFQDQQHADQFYEDYNLRPFSSLEPEIICRLVYVREVQIMSPHRPSTTIAAQHAQHAPPQLSHTTTTTAVASSSAAAPGAAGEASTSGGGAASTSTGLQAEDLGRSPRQTPGQTLLQLLHQHGGPRSNRASRAGTPRAVTPRRLSASALGEGSGGGAGDAGGGDAWDRLQPVHLLGTELPTCPVCLERLDEHISGVVITVCNHQFHSDCLRKWGDTSCPVCRYCTQANAHSSKCVTCNATHDLWICLICGHVGCGRYKAGHASEHWKATNHCYALELETQRVWDYAGDNYVHRLIQSKTDGKLVEVPTPGPPRHRHRHGRHHSGSQREGSGHAGSMRGGARRCIAHEALQDAHGPGGAYDDYDDYDDGSDWYEGRADDDDMKEAMFASKLDHIADEYNHLLTSQLDSQRAYYEGLLAQQAASLTHRISQVEAAAASHQAAAAAAHEGVKEAERKRQALEKKLADVSAAHARAVEERGFLQALNDTLLANQKQLRQQAESAKGEVQEKDKQINDLQEQVRDLMVFIEAGKVIQSSTELEGATVLPTPAAANGSGGGPSRSKAARTRKQSGR